MAATTNSASTNRAAAPGATQSFSYGIPAFNPPPVPLVKQIYDPFRALRRCMQGGNAYWHAWLIALTALAISFVGFVAGGVGVLVNSVWFWQVAGFSFASVSTQQFQLGVAKQD
jgi:hypothetical protein